VKEAQRLFRVLLEVPDFEKAVTFYSRLLGVKGRKLAGGRHYFDCGSVILGLVGIAPAGRKIAPKPECLYLAVNDLEKAHVRARALRCLSIGKVHGESAGEILRRPWGERSFYAEDPFGNGVCFIDARTLSPGK